MIARSFGLMLALAMLAAPCRLAGQAAASRGISVAALAHQSLVRSALDDLLPPERSVPQVGLEVSAPTFWQPLRLTGRVLRSTRGGDDLNSLDAGLLMGWQHVALEAAYSQRASYSPETGLAHSRNADFARAGLRAQMPVGLTGFSLHLRGHAYIPTSRAAVREDEIEGWEGQSGLTYTFATLPLNATLGYRLERFRIFGVEQEVSALTFALGFTFFGR